MTPRDITVAIPTYHRGRVLLDTLEALCACPSGAEVLVVDQTPSHEPAVAAALEEMVRGGAVRWLRLPRPSIPAAMNEALRQSTRPLVLFLDDDIVPANGLLEGHASAFQADEVWAVAGQVLQPGQEPVGDGPRFETRGLRAFLDFPFHSERSAWIENGMAGNLSVRRHRALELGGFDENFVGVAYRFETDFCRRLCRAGGRILFEPRARIHHLRAPRGGTRAYGNHLTSVSPAHAVGDYYFALRHGAGWDAVGYILARPLRSVATRFHLKRPWWIPVKMVGEVGGFLWAVRLAAGGPRFARPAAECRKA